MLVREVREGLEGVPDDALVIVWHDGMRIKQELNGTTGSFRPARPTSQVPPREPPKPRYRTLYVQPSSWRHVTYLTSYAASAGLSTVAHLFDPNASRIGLTIDLETNQWTEAWGHFGAVCGQHWTANLNTKYDNTAEELAHESLPKGFRLCKLCAKYGGVKICQHCAVPLTGTQKKWCSAHSSAHMRREA